MRKEKSTYKKGIVIVLASMLLLTTVLVIRLAWLDASPQPIFVGPVPPADYATIQEAINNAPEGGIIEVMDEGSPYIENVVVNKSLTIERWTPSKPECVVDGNWTGPVFNITASNAKIFNFTVQHGTYGIFIAPHSRNNTLIRDKLTANSLGFGIDIDQASSVLEDFIQNIDNSTSINGRPIYYWMNEHDRQVPTNAGYVALVNSTNIIVKDFTLANNRQGILIAYTNHSLIENMAVWGTDDGVHLWHSNDNVINASFVSFNGAGIHVDNGSGNTLTDNMIADNSNGIYLFNSSYNIIAGNNITRCYPGIRTQYSNYNVFYHNNMMNGAGYQRLRDMSSTPWDNGMEGNYWNDFQGSDANGDGIIDAPYDPIVDHGSPDRYPLKDPWSSTRSLNITLWGIPINYSQYRIPYFITTYSDHVVANITYHVIYGFVTFNVTAGSPGYCNITVPRDRLDHPFNVTVDGVSRGYTWDFNETHSWLYFTYTNGTHNVKIEYYRVGRLFGDLTGPNGVPDGVINMRDIGELCKYFNKRIEDYPGILP